MDYGPLRRQMQFTPQEESAQMAEDYSPENLAALDLAIRQEKNPGSKAVLMAERQRLSGPPPQAGAGRGFVNPAMAFASAPPQASTPQAASQSPPANSQANDIITRLLQGDPASEARRQAQLLRGQQQMRDIYSQGDQQAHALDMLNFVVQGGANNPALAKSMEALAQIQRARYTPRQVDKSIVQPSTGESVEIPSFAEEKDAARDARNLQAAGIVAAREDAAARALQSHEIMAESLRVQRQAAEDARQETQRLRQERFENTKAQQQQTQVREFSKTLDKAGIPQIDSAIKDMHNMFETYKPGQTPGVGYGQESLSKIPIVSDLTMGTEGKNNRATIQRLVNAMMLTEAGKAVTKNEEVRQAVANMQSDRYSDADARHAFYNVIIPALEAHRVNALRSAPADVVKDYVANAPGDFDPRVSWKRESSAAKSVAPKVKPEAFAPTRIKLDAQGNEIK